MLIALLAFTKPTQADETGQEITLFRSDTRLLSAERAFVARHSTTCLDCLALFQNRKARFIRRL
jgi:hypothetical protein